MTAFDHSIKTTTEFTTGLTQNLVVQQARTTLVTFSSAVMQPTSSTTLTMTTSTTRTTVSRSTKQLTSLVGTAQQQPIQTRSTRIHDVKHVEPLSPNLTTGTETVSSTGKTSMTTTMESSTFSILIGIAISITTETSTLSMVRCIVTMDRMPSILILMETVLKTTLTGTMITTVFLTCTTQTMETVERSTRISMTHSRLHSTQSVTSVLSMVVKTARHIPTIYRIIGTWSFGTTHLQT